jgi:hypothetical protein
MTLRCLELLSRCIKRQGKHALASPMLEQLVSLKTESKEGGADASMASVFSDLAECYRAVGREEDAGKMDSRGDKVVNVVKEKLEELDRQAKEKALQEQAESSEEEEEDSGEDSDEENKSNNEEKSVERGESWRP